MRTIISLLLAILMIMSLVGCGNTKDISSESSDISDENENSEIPQKIVYTFYAGGSTDETGGTTITGFQAAGKLANNSVDHLGNNKVTAEDQIFKTVKIDGTQKNYKLKFAYQLSLSKSSNDILRTMDSKEIYLLADDTVEMISGNDEISYYFNGSKPDGLTPAREDAIAKATQVIEEIYGKGVLDDYVVKDFSEGDINSKGSLYILFRRYLFGYPTESCIGVSLDGHCQVMALSAESHLLYRQIIGKSGITEEMLKNAEAALREVIPARYNVQDHTMRVFMDYMTGKFYLKITGTAPIKNQDPESDSPKWDVCDFYVNIN